MSAYRDTLDFLYSQLPMYQRVGNVAFKKGLGNTRALLKASGNPHRRFPCIHIAGTNGKGTVSHMLAACFTAAGFRTGLYVSPHYRDFRERMKIDGELIPKQDVTEYVAQMQDIIREVKPSFFEMTVAMAFHVFANHHVDIAIIETGLGGRLDSTNVVQPLVSIITNISFDHMAMLGNTLPKIAREKAGIIKRNTPVVIGEYQTEVASVFKAVAKRRHAPISFADRRVKVALVKDGLDRQRYAVRQNTDNSPVMYTIGCAGPFQGANLTTVLHALDIIGQTDNRFHLTAEQIAKGLLHIRKLSAYQGRWQVLGRKPLILTDSAHNPAGIARILERIARMRFRQKHFVLGVVSDKDLDAVLGLFPKEAKYYFCRPDIPRGMDAHELCAVGELYGLQGRVYGSVRKALAAAKRAATENDLIFVGGSTFVVAEVI